MCVQADTTITNAAISACGAGRDAAHARHIFDEMTHAGLVPDHITYKTLIAALVRCNEWQPCVEVRPSSVIVLTLDLLPRHRAGLRSVFSSPGDLPSSNVQTICKSRF